MRLVFSAAVLSLALAGCAGGPGAAGTAEIPSGFSTYYVRANGSDSNDGLSEAASFKTLSKAVDAAVKGRIPVITVLGVLNPKSEGESSLYPDYVFNITDTRGTELTIRGKEGADEAEQGVLSGAGAGKIVIAVREESRVRLEHLRVEGGSSEYTGAGIQVRDQARLTLGEGTLIRDNHSQSAGGGVAVAESGTFIMEGGEISGNTAQGGGGVVVAENGTFTMQSGEITGNESAMSGGGVVVAENGTFTMENGIISGNTTQSNGGGVAVWESESFTMRGGVISGNTAQGGGGGVVAVNGSFTMENGEISGNKSAMTGGGVMVAENGTFTMRGGEISGN
jgi:hypothetical protein